MTSKKHKDMVKNIDDNVFKGAVDDFDKFEDFVSTNLYKIVIGAIVLVVAIIVAFMIYTTIQEANNKASVALSSAKSVEELKKAIKKYPKSNSGGIAKLNLATLYFNDKKYENALQTYQSIANTNASDDIKGRAQLNTAYTLEKMKKQDQAAAKFSEIGLNAASPAYIRDEANYSAARIYLLLNKPSMATSCLKAVKTETPNGFWNSQAARLLQRIADKDPVPDKITSAKSIPDAKKAETKKISTKKLKTENKK